MTSNNNFAVADRARVSVTGTPGGLVNLRIILRTENSWSMSPLTARQVLSVVSWAVPGSGGGEQRTAGQLYSEWDRCGLWGCQLTKNPPRTRSHLLAAQNIHLTSHILHLISCLQLSSRSLHRNSEMELFSNFFPKIQLSFIICSTD